VDILNKKENPGSLVCIFPQGQLLPWHARPVNFQKGLAWILNTLNSPTIIQLLAMKTEFKENQKPETFFQFSRPRYYQDLKKNELDTLQSEMETLLLTLFENIVQEGESQIIVTGNTSIDRKWNSFQSLFKFKDKN
jgi:hypothetical protein